MKPSTRRLSEVARHVVQPSGIVSTGYPAVEATCRDMGIIHDEWQRGLGRLILGKRADGKYAATVGGVVLSIPRQVGKTFTVGSIIFALCVLHPGMTVLWTAHRTRTSNETFASMQGTARRKKVTPHVEYVRQTNGEQEIRFRNGSRILFGAREAGFGRGFSEVDIEVFDEAQILTERALEDMVAATNQARHPAGALLFYMGTPPRPVDPGEAFRNKRARALSGQSQDIVYVELSADESARKHADDRAQWAKANPSYPERTPVESMMRLRENVGSDESFVREGLGVWDEDNIGGALNVSRWKGLADPDAPRGDSVVFGVDVEEDRAAWFAVAWRRPDGAVQVQLVEVEPRPAGELVNRAKELSASWGGSFVPPRAFEADLEREGVRVVKLTGADFPGACGDVFDAVERGELRHGNQDPLNKAVQVAQWRVSAAGGERSRAWQLKDAAGIGPLIAATRAVHGLSVATVPLVHEWPDDDDLEG